MATLSDLDGSQRCFRTLKLVVEGGGYFLREFLKQKAVQPSGAFNTLDDFLASNKTSIDRLKQKKIIKDAQYDILYPQNNTPSNIDNWDITLTSCVLINCLNLSQIERKTVVDIRILRNTLHGHSTTLSLTESEFQTHWVDVSTCLTNASLLLTSVRCKNHVSDMIRTIHTESLSQAENIEILKLWLTWDTAVDKKLDDIADRQDTLGDSFDDIKNSLNDIEMYMKQKEAKIKKEQVDQRKLNREIEAAKTRIEDHMEQVKETNIVSETRSTSIFTEKLKKNNIIILTGIPGSGKTFLAFNILKQILKDDDSGPCPLIMSVPNEFKKVFDPSRNLVLFVDDMLGKFSVDNSELDQWNRYVDQFLSFIRTRKLLVIITIRKNIMSTCMKKNISKLFDADHIYDLDKMQFSAKEKEEMIIRYAERDNIEVNKEELQVAVQQKDCGIGFPFLCTIMKNNNIRQLFSGPVEFIKQELLTMKDNDKASFVALLMTLFCDNKMYKSCLDAQQQDCFNDIKNYFSSSGIDMGKMFDAAEALDKTYLTKNAEYFSFVHDTIAESTFSAASDSILDILIHFCPLEILTKLFGKEQKEESAHTANPLPYKKIADRFKSEIDKRQTVMQCIGASSLWQKKAFCKIAFETLDTSLFYKEDEENKSLLCYLSRFGRGDLIQRIIKTDTSVVPKEVLERHMCMGVEEACMFGNVDSFKCLITKVVHISDDMLFAAIHGGNCGILKNLLEKGGNIRARKTDTKETLLHEVCARNDYDSADLILSKCDESTRAKLLSSTTDVDKKIPLLYAAMKGNAKMVRLLLDNGSNIDSEDKEGFNSLHCAAMYGNIDVVQYICTHHKSMLNTISKKGYTVAHAATAGDITCLEYLLEKGLHSNDVTHDGATLLHEASINGKVQVTKHLCENYHEMMQIFDKDGETACHYAARSGHVGCLTTLIEHGMDPTGSSLKGYTPLHEAAFCGKLDVVKYICDHFSDAIQLTDRNGENAAHHAAVSGHLDCLTYLTVQKIDPRNTSKKGFTILHKAAQSGNLNMVKYLVETYKDMITLRAENGDSAAVSAVIRGNIDCLKYLIKPQGGIDPMLTNTNKSSLLHHASYFGRLDIVKYLSETCQQLVNRKNIHGGSAAFEAASGGHLDCLTYLIQQKANPWATDTKSRTLLHTAAFRGRSNVVKYLCEKYDTMVKEKDIYEENAAHKAATGGHLTCLKLVIDHNIDPMDLNRNKMTVLNLAAQRGWNDIVKYLCDTQPKLVKMYSIAAAE